MNKEKKTKQANISRMGKILLRSVAFSIFAISYLSFRGCGRRNTYASKKINESKGKNGAASLDTYTFLITIIIIVTVTSA